MGFLNTLPNWAYTLIGVLLLVLGVSFVYKGWSAAVLGRCYYWSGFLPITLISPWMIHFPPGENSLIKKREGLLCHMLIGPLFFLTAMFCLLFGADFVGLPGSDTVNFILAGGDRSKPAAIIYSPPANYRWPIVARAGKQIDKIFQTQIYEDPSRSMLPGQHGTQQSAEKVHNK